MLSPRASTSRSTSPAPSISRCESSTARRRRTWRWTHPSSSTATTSLETSAPRAAARLESLGFSRVHDYAGGKADWVVHGLPLEGRTAGRRRAIEVCRKDIPTCGPHEPLGEVRDRVRAGGYEMCVVVNERGIVLGRLQRKSWEKEPESLAEDCMQLGPPTTRPDHFLHEVIGRFRKGNLDRLLVTWYGRDEDGGRLVGVLFREDVERVLAENERLPR